jgi:enoyl-[acyl-carrier-protein] reductase (NADH)
LAPRGAPAARPAGRGAPPPAPRSVKNPNGRTAAQIASDAAWTFVSSNKDWFGEDARKLFETDQQWHDRLLAKKKAAFVPSMETVYDENGRPVEVGYFDWGGNWVRTRDLSSLNAAMAGLAEAANATPTLIDIRGTPEYQSLTELQKQLNDPNNTQADMDAAEQRAAEEMGLTVPELRQRLADMREQANLGKNAQQGMTQQEISEFDRKTALERQELLRQGQEILQQVMGKSGGSAIAASNARNNIINTLASFQAQKDAQQTELDWEKKIAEYDALVARYDQLFQQKDLTAGRYLDAIKEDRTAAIQATFYQLNALAQQNQAEIDKYTAIGSMRYQEVMAQLGVLQGVSEQELNDFEKYIAPIRLKMEQEALEAQKNAQSANNILGIISSIIGTIALFAK